MTEYNVHKRADWRLVNAIVRWKAQSAPRERKTKRMTQTILIRLATAAMFVSSAFANQAAANQAGAQPGGGTTSPTPVKEVEKPALSAVAASCDVVLQNQSNGICSALIVPAGKVLVIEHLSGICGFNDAAPVSVLALNVRTSIGGSPNVDVEIPMTKQAVGNGFAYWKGSHAVRSYANPGTVVQPFGLRTTGAVTLGYCSVTVIGHYVQAQ